MKKRGQVTVFIIVGLIVIIAVAIFFFISQKSSDKTSIPVNIRPINSFIVACVEETSRQGIELIGLQGGYYNEPVLSTYYLYNNIPYYWKSNGQSEVPTIKIIEQEISEYVQDYLPYCLNEFTIFENSSYTINGGDISVSSTISDNKLEINVNYPISISSEEEITELKEFSSTIPSDLKKAHTFSKQIIEEQKEDPNLIPLSFIMDLTSNNNFKYETIELEEDDILYTLLFGDEDNPYIYAFVADYNWENQEEFGEIEI